MEKNQNISLTNLILSGLCFKSADMFRSEHTGVSRSEFQHKVGAVVTNLRTMHFSVGDRIVLHGFVEPDLIATMLACFLEGLVVVPLDASMPKELKLAMVATCKPALIADFVGENSWPHCLQVPGKELLHDEHSLLHINFANIPPNSPAYVFFTSGTTGTPKAVLGKRMGLAHFIDWEVKKLSLLPNDRVSILTRLSFDVILRDILLPVVSGATSCIFPRQGNLDPKLVLDWLKRLEISVCHIVPSVAQKYLSLSSEEFYCSTLKYTLFAGEPLFSALVNHWRHVFPQTTVYNLYGPTETTLAKFFAEIPSNLTDGVQPCGHPLPDTKAIIVDENKETLGKGQIGEVVISTEHCSLGYLNPASKDSRKFVKIDGQTAYMTGDLGFLDDNGVLHLRGRNDDQVKILGTRVELTSLKATLHSHPSVRDAVVVCRENENGKQLVAFCVLNSCYNKEKMVQDLRLFLSKRVALAVIPAHFVFLPEIPLTFNGKVDKPKLHSMVLSSEKELPKNNLEKTIVEAFSTVLNRKSVGVTEDFFSLGGDSLAAMNLCAELESLVPHYIHPRDLLSFPTTRQLAEMITSKKNACSRILNYEVSEYFHLTPFQKRYFRILCAAGDGLNWCNMASIYDLPDGVDSDDVEQALRYISTRHNSLLLKFVRNQNNKILQSIDFNMTFELELTNLQHLHKESLLIELNKLRLDTISRPFSLFCNKPLFRANLVILPNHKRKLVWSDHHMVNDGTGHLILGRLLRGYLEKGTTAVPDVTSFYHIAKWSNGVDRNIRNASKYYREMLLSPKPYSHCYPPEKTQAEDPQRCSLFQKSLPENLRQVLNQSARSYHCSPYTLLIAVVFRFLSELTQKDDVCVLTPLAGRIHPETANVVAHFNNVLPLRLQGVSRYSSKQLVEKVKVLVREAALYQDFQFDEIVDLINVKIDKDRTPISSYMINYLPINAEGFSWSGNHADGGHKHKCDLTFMVRDFNSFTNFEVQYRSGLWYIEEVEHFLERYFYILETFLNEKE